MEQGVIKDLYPVLQQKLTRLGIMGVIFTKDVVNKPSFNWECIENRSLHSNVHPHITNILGDEATLSIYYRIGYQEKTDDNKGYYRLLLRLEYKGKYLKSLKDCIIIHEYTEIDGWNQII